MYKITDSLDMTVLSSNDLNCSNTILLGLVSKHGTRDDVADGINAGDVCAKVVVDEDLSPLSLDPELLNPQTLDEWAAT